jgi:transposase
MRLSSDFGAFLKPTQIRSPRLKERLWLDDVGSRMTQLKDMIHQEQCRSSHPAMTDPFLQASLQKILTLLETELKACEQAMMERISQDPVLKRTYEILISMPGVGRITALTILGSLGEIGHLSKKEVAALVGVAPLTRESGLKRGRGRIMYGRANVRKVLYMAALVACQHNQAMKEFYRRLTEKGKAKKVAIIAVLRKMVVTLNAMVKTGTTWNRQHQSDAGFKDTHVHNAYFLLASKDGRSPPAWG